MEQQYQNGQVEEGISLIDIVRLLLSKIKLLLVVVLIGGILGGSFAVWRTIDVNQFGTKVEFYVNPEKPEDSTGASAGAAAGGSQYGVYGAYGRHVMDNIVKLLSSDSFAEKLLLNGSYTPDVENTQWFAEEEVDENDVSKNLLLKQAVEAAQAPIQEAKEAEDAYNAALLAKAEVVKIYSNTERDLLDTWRSVYPELVSSNGSVSTTFTEKAYAELITKPAKLEAAYEVYSEAYNTVVQKTKDVTNAEETWKTMKNAAFGLDGPVEKALNLWRESSVYASRLGFYKESVSYSYLAEDVDQEDANNLARSFIYVKISVTNGNAQEGIRIGTDLLNRVKRVVPAYVEENMTVPDGYSGTNCQRITRTDNIELTNPLYTTKQAIKYAILMAIAAGVLAAVLIVILDRSDKRLRDPDMLSKKLNVPLLGIVPTIEELKAEQAAKKKADKTSEVK